MLEAQMHLDPKVFSHFILYQQLFTNWYGYNVSEETEGGDFIEEVAKNSTSGKK
jgi:hypothetical protein